MTQASLDAYISIAEALPEKRRRVYEVVVRYSRQEGDGGHYGVTIGEVAAALELGNQLHLVSPRLTELKRLGLIYACAERRDGQTVWAAVQDPPLLLRFDPVPKRKALAAFVVEYDRVMGPGNGRLTLDLTDTIPDLDRLLAKGARVKVVLA